MRTLVLVLAMLTGLVAAPALAAVKPAASGGEAPVPKKSAPAIPAAAPAPEAPPAKPRPAPIAAPLVTTPIFSPLPADTGDCRLGCARAYYFCLSNDDADSCGTTWTGCRSDCARAANP